MNDYEKLKEEFVKQLNKIPHLQVNEKEKLLIAEHFLVPNTILELTAGTCLKVDLSNYIIEFNENKKEELKHVLDF